MIVSFLLLAQGMSGKHKHNAKLLTNQQSLCKLHVTRVDGKSDEEVEGLKENCFLIYSCLNGKLIEINEKLITNPDLLQEKGATEGFLAIVMTKLENWKKQVEELTTHQKYVEHLNEKCQNL